MAMIKKSILSTLFFLVTIWPLTINAGWIGPTEIIIGQWGSNDKEFGYQSGDTKDQFPGNFITLSNGKIIIEDWINNRIKIYSPLGMYLKSISQPGYGLYEQGSDKIITFKWNEQLKSNSIGNFNLKQEKWEWIDDKNSFRYVSNIDLIVSNSDIFIWDDKKGYHYSSTGQLLKTYDTRPLELGVVLEQSLGGRQYKITITYPDKTWEMIQEWGACPKYERDACGNLYCGGGKGLIKYDSDGKEVATVTFPKNNIQKAPSSTPGLEPDINVLEEYGEAVLAPNGDVYTWKRTPDKYSIIKWVWVDGPECPQNLVVTPTKTSLKFTWQKPLKDADKVSYYQLLQSFNICGPFRQVNLFKKDKLSYEDRDVKKGETYYYMIKAVRGKEYSGNSNKVCGQIE